MAEQFVSEAIRPAVATCDTSRMAAGEPGLPRAFIWRGQTVEIAELMRSWRETGPCRNGSGESYVRKHWCASIRATAIGGFGRCCDGRAGE